MSSQAKKKEIVILVGPSGAGKSTLLDRLVKEDSRLCDIITCTTRELREGESQGDPYNFVSRSQFEELLNKGHFVEWAEVHGNLYGTPCIEFERVWGRGQVAIMDIDPQGAQAFQEKYPQTKTIFIHPPSIDALRKRLQERDPRSHEPERAKQIEVRIENAKKEMEQAGAFDLQLVNEDLEQCYHKLKNWIEDQLKQG